MSECAEPLITSSSCREKPKLSSKEYIFLKESCGDVEQYRKYLSKA